MEAGTVKGVVTISATIPGRNRAIHVSSGESYFGGDVMVGEDVCSVLRDSGNCRAAEDARCIPEY